MTGAERAVLACARRLQLGGGRFDDETRAGVLRALLDHTDGDDALDAELTAVSRTWTDRAAFDAWVTALSSR
jgi:hypothetical protein